MSTFTSRIIDSVSNIFSEFISREIPRKVSNVLWGLFRGVQAMFQHLEWKIDILMRERNMMSAVHISSLRSLAAENGFEPSLPTPATGIAKITVSQSLYARYGYPVFIPPYATFVCKENGLQYYYDSDRSLRLTSNEYNIPLVEGEIKNLTFEGTGEKIQRIYLSDNMIANGSIKVVVGSVTYTEVKSFFDQDGYNQNRQYIVKHSNDPQTPIILYVKGVNLTDIISVTYRTTFGILGNISTLHTFETADIIDNNGNQISVDKEMMKVESSSGFRLGSQGTDISALRSAIGFNHGGALLFDNNSYRNFINRYSTLLLQKIIVSDDNRSINNIYVGKKNIINTTNQSQLIHDYVSIIAGERYNADSEDLRNLSESISNHEYCLSSHNLLNIDVVKYALQIKFNNIADRDYHSVRLEKIIYEEFSKFLYDIYHSFNLEQIFYDYQNENRVRFEYHIFTNIDIKDAHIVAHGTDRLPILKGDFEIKTSTGENVKLFSDINMVIK